jgi:GntR family transcriptional regulator, transcriptional repressor for pyruvate dehydrogenase complex
LVASDTRQVGQNIRAVKTGEMIASFLRAKIVRGEFAEGDSLPPEAELMRQFEVSRPTLREAFRILETESLIMIRRGARGARITAPKVEVAARHVGLIMQISGTTLADVYEARSLIEPEAAALLAARRTDADLADLAACIDGLESLIEAGGPPANPRASNPRAWLPAAQRFHDLLTQRAGNKTLAIQALVLREVVDCHLLLAAREPAGEALTADSFRKAIKSFRRLLALVQAKDAAGARRHWQTHMAVAGRALLPEQLRSATVLDMFS